MPRTVKFGTDGWRAIIAEDYTFDNVRLAAQATAEYFQQAGVAERGIVVGYDTRFGSERFARSVVEVLAANGVRALLSDRFQPTPVLSYSVIDRKAGGAIVITSSHNPAAYNGFKVKMDIGASASPEVVERIEANVDRLEDGGLGAIKRLPFAEAERCGLVETFDATPAYVAQIGRLVDLERLRGSGLSVVSDAMYGTGSGYFTRFLSGGSTRIQEIRAEYNPGFPGIAPEPIPPHIDELGRVAARERADAGIATDGDADRVGAVAEDGQFVTQHQVFALLVLYLTKFRKLRGTAVRSVTMSSQADRYLEQLGTRMIETPVGFKYIGSAMAAEDALIGGEESGGFGFRGHLPERDGILSGLYLLDLLVEIGKPMSGALALLREEFGEWHYSRIDLTFPAEQRQAIYERVAAAKPADLTGDPVATVRALETGDGFKLHSQDGSWLMIRFSGTEPLLRIYTETTSPERVQHMLQQGREMAGL